MARLRLWDCRLSRLPSIIGCCADDLPTIAGAVNTAQRRLLMAKEAGEEGWWGTWAEVAFNVNKEKPYITLPREIARLEAISVCSGPVPIYNQFFEYLRFGNGRMPQQCGGGSCDGGLSVYQRNNVPTFTTMESGGQSISVYPSISEDTGKRILLQGTDSNGTTIYTRDVFSRVTGIFLSLQQPFVASPITFNSLTGIQKDLTSGPVQIFGTDPLTGVQTLLHTMEPSEEVANYQRYYLSSISASGFPGDDVDTVSVTALAKLDLIPVRVDTDYLLIQNLEAIISECASVRYSEVDTPSSKGMAAVHHREAISYLNGELTHYLGKETNSIIFSPFGSARLERLKIGMI